MWNVFGESILGLQLIRIPISSAINKDIPIWLRMYRSINDIDGSIQHWFLGTLKFTNVLRLNCDMSCFFSNVFPPSFDSLSSIGKKCAKEVSSTVIWTWESISCIFIGLRLIEIILSTLRERNHDKVVNHGLAWTWKLVMNKLHLKNQNYRIAFLDHCSFHHVGRRENNVQSG